MPRRRIEQQDALPGEAAGLRAGKSADSPAVPAICRRIRHFREQRHLEQKELAGILGISGNTICNWENGRARPDLNLIPPLCAALGVPFSELFGAEDPSDRYSPEEKSLIGRYRALTPAHRVFAGRMIDSLLEVQEAEVAPEIRKLVLFEKSLAAGIGDPLEFEDEGTPIYLYASRDVDRADCVFAVNGDSMEPRFHSGDMVLVSRIPDAPDLQAGEIGAFIVGNEAYIKQYEKDGLHSLNPAYGVMRFSDQDSVYLIGRVIGTLDPGCVVSPAAAEQYERTHGQAIG